MSAVAGIITTDGSPVPVELAKRITIAGVRRGKDALALKLFSKAALGSALLRITNEDNIEEQPVGLEAEGLWITLDGRFDNRAELLTALSLSSQDKSISDCRLALLAYKQWGRQCVDKLIGTFALILWDTRAQYLFCAVDHLAARPLFYVHQSRYLIVASTIHQLLQDDTVAYDIDDTYMFATLCIPSAGPLWSKHTPYQKVCRLLPAHTLTIHCDGRFEEKRYWYPERLPVLYSASQAHLTELVRHTFFEVVRTQLRSSSYVMPTLSGGLDSSSITCTAAVLQQKEALPCRGLLPCSVTYGHRAESNEQAFRQTALDLYNLPLVEIQGESHWHLKALMDEAPCPDEPFGAYAAWREVQAYAEAAHGANCNVVMFGFGGDEFMTGGDFFLADLLRRGHISALAQGILERAHLPNRNLTSALLKLAIFPLLPSSFWQTRLAACQRRKHWDYEAEFYRPMVPPWLSVEAYRRHGVFDAVWCELPERWSKVPSRSALLENLRRNMTLTWMDNYAFMPMGCETRTPFYDRRFIELSFMIPESFKSQVGERGKKIGKILLRGAMRGVLPEQIRNRKSKASFNSQLALGLRNEWAELIHGGNFQVVERNYVARDQLEHFLPLWRLGRWDYLGQIVNLLVAEIWLRREHENRHQSNMYRSDAKRMSLL